MKYQNVKILFIFSLSFVTRVMKMAAIWVASIKNVASVIFIIDIIYYRMVVYNIYVFIYCDDMYTATL